MICQVPDIVVDPSKKWRYESIECVIFDHANFVGFGISGLDDDSNRFAEAL